MEAVLGMAVDQNVLEWTVKSWETISDLCCTKLAANWKNCGKVPRCDCILMNFGSQRENCLTLIGGLWTKSALLYSVICGDLESSLIEHDLKDLLNNNRVSAGWLSFLFSWVWTLLFCAGLQQTDGMGWCCVYIPACVGAQRGFH